MSSDVAVQEKETIVSKENTDHEEKASHDVTKATDITIPKATRRGRKRKAEKAESICCFTVVKGLNFCFIF